MKETSHHEKHVEQTYLERDSYIRLGAIRRLDGCLLLSGFFYNWSQYANEPTCCLHQWEIVLLFEEGVLPIGQMK